MTTNQAMGCLFGLAVCGLSACYPGAHGERCRGERESQSLAADGAHVSLKLALASRDEQQLCKLVLAERGFRLTWADAQSSKRAHHGLRALRGCAGLLRQAVADAAAPRGRSSQLDS